jgi:hypothetical protein
MNLFLYRTGLLSVVTIFFFTGTRFTGKQSTLPDTLRNAPELSMPITDKKLVIAHCMTNIIRYKGHKLEDSCNPEFYSPGGNISAPIGGLTQVKVLADPYLANASLEEAVEFEMRAAIQSGIDGFQFYYTLGNDSWDAIIKAYLKVATQKNIDFKFTFCISHPSGGDEDSRIADFAKRMNSILDEAGHNNPHWLRTPDGRLILYTWYGDNLADIPATITGRPAAYYVANAYKKLGEAVKEKLACIISINEQISKEKLNQYLDYFPAVWLWTLPYTDSYIGNMVAAECKRRKRIFTGSAFPGFYTSKLLKKGTWDMFHYAEDAVRAGIKNSERKYIVTGLSYNFRKQWEFGIDKDVQLMNIITWNDYPEGHHLAPEANHNDGFSLLLRHYKAVWKKEASPFDNDVVIAFYKKYNHKLTPSPYNIPVIEIEKPGISVNYEDSIEVISILKEKGTLKVNGSNIDIAAGLQTTRFAAAPGAVNVSCSRSGQVVAQFNCPEWITDKPYRTDRMTCSFSNYSDAMIRNLFGNALTVDPGEYNANAPGNNIHFYKGK